MFQIPIANDLGWFRTEFSLAIAIQNLAWGIATPYLARLLKSWATVKHTCGSAYLCPWTVIELYRDYCK